MFHAPGRDAEFVAVLRHVPAPISLLVSAQNRTYSPCYLNMNNPADVGLSSTVLTQIANDVSNIFGKGATASVLTECLSAPDQEIVLPRDL